MAALTSLNPQITTNTQATPTTPRTAPQLQGPHPFAVNQPETEAPRSPREITIRDGQHPGQEEVYRDIFRQIEQTLPYLFLYPPIPRTTQNLNDLTNHILNARNTRAAILASNAKNERDHLAAKHLYEKWYFRYETIQKSSFLLGVSLFCCCIFSIILNKCSESQNFSLNLKQLSLTTGILSGLFLATGIASLYRKTQLKHLIPIPDNVQIPVPTNDFNLHLSDAILSLRTHPDFATPHPA